MGNVDYNDNWLTEGSLLASKYLSSILLEDSSFVSAYQVRWNTLRNNQFTISTINSLIDDYVELLGTAQERNFERWPILGSGVWPNYYIGITYEDEVNYLKQWITDRFIWMDSQLLLEDIDGCIGQLDECGVCNGNNSICTGCSYQSACNYDANATIDDGSCVFTEQFYDCDGNCITEIDCAGECNGLAKLDECGVCNGDNSTCTGCIDNTACNYNIDATIEGECEYAEENYDCDGNCIVTGENLDENGLDCSELCGGSDVSCLSIQELIIPQEYNISSIYPNPFNPVTNIIYGLPEHINVQILVYDLSGQQVETLINEHQTPGYHSVNWNADNLPSGVYLVRMESGEFTQTQKMVLVK